MTDIHEQLAKILLGLETRHGFDVVSSTDPPPAEPPLLVSMETSPSGREIRALHDAIEHRGFRTGALIPSLRGRSVSRFLLDEDLFHHAVSMNLPVGSRWMLGVSEKASARLHAHHRELLSPMRLAAADLRTQRIEGLTIKNRDGTTRPVPKIRLDTAARYHIDFETRTLTPR